MSSSSSHDMEKLIKFIDAVPKAELHVHIEGSLEPELLFSLAQKNKIPIPYKSVEEIAMAYRFNNLQSFLDLFYQGMSVLQTESDFAELAFAYTRHMDSNNIKHSEPFFDFQGHVSRGVPMRTVYDGLMTGFRKGMIAYGVSVKPIISFLRHCTEAECLEALQAETDDGECLRQLFAEEAFVAIGLDSSELGNPPENFKRLFKYCREVLKVPLAVAHAGEEGPAEYIWSAIKVLHVQRVDHGVASCTDPALRAHLRELEMPLTVCPLSNVELKVFDSEETCAKTVMGLLRDGLRVTINSDDPAYFGGYINNNYKMLMKSGELTPEDVVQLAKNSFESSFIAKEEKKAYCDAVDAAYRKHYAH